MSEFSSIGTEISVSDGGLDLSYGGADYAAAEGFLDTEAFAVDFITVPDYVPVEWETTVPEVVREVDEYLIQQIDEIGSLVLADAEPQAFNIYQTLEDGGN